MRFSASGNSPDNRLVGNLASRWYALVRKCTRYRLLGQVREPGLNTRVVAKVGNYLVWPQSPLKCSGRGKAAPAKCQAVLDCRLNRGRVPSQTSGAQLLGGYIRFDIAQEENGNLCQTHIT
jgi:hypothetical protein